MTSARQAQPARAPGGASGSGRAADRTIPVTLALTALTLGAAAGMGRLFKGTTWMAPAFGAVLLAHGVAWIGRRLDLSPSRAVALSAAGVVVFAVWASVPQATAYGIPWAGAWHAVSTALGQARTAYSQTAPPTVPIPGFIFATTIALGTVAVLADWAAFRIRATLEACIPAFVIFIFTATLDQAHHHRGTFTAIFLVPLVGFALLHQADLRAGSSAWFASRERGGPAALLEGGAVIGGIAVLLALLIGPNLPTARAAGVINTHTGGSPGVGSNRSVPSPLVDIRNGLVQESAIEFFTVKSSAPAYWRLTALDTFDGSIWSANESYKSVRHKLPGVEPSAAGVDEVDQTFSISSLSSVWLPAAYEPVEVTGAHQVSFNPDSGSLITAATSSDDQTYRVRSDVAAGHLTPAALNQVTDLSAVDTRYLALPPITPQIQALATRIVAGATSPYQKALALQNFFHGNGFKYSLNVPPGHSSDALFQFLFRTRTGFCEQYAGAYGVLARMVGLPTRIAVGFTPGDLEGDGLYHVKGMHYHAWPEVYFNQYGWVAFEPTPGRGQPDAQAYTGLPAAQDTVGDAAGTTVTTAPPTTPSSTPSAPPTTLPRGETNQPSTTGRTRRTHYLRYTGITLAVLLGLLVLGVAATAAALSYRARRRREAATTPRARILLDWDDTVELLGLAGAPRRPGETIAEYASRAPASTGLNSDGRAGLRHLAGAAEVAAYAPPDGVADADQAHAAARTVADALRQDASWQDRWRWEVDPRRLSRPIVPAPDVEWDVGQDEPAGVTPRA